MTRGPRLPPVTSEIMAEALRDLDMVRHVDETMHVYHQATCLRRRTQGHGPCTCTPNIEYED